VLIITLKLMSVPILSTVVAFLLQQMQSHILAYLQR
jgi:hypothetical protein